SSNIAEKEFSFRGNTSRQTKCLAIRIVRSLAIAFVLCGCIRIIRIDLKSRQADDISMSDAAYPLENAVRIGVFRQQSPCSGIEHCGDRVLIIVPAEEHDPYSG